MRRQIRWNFSRPATQSFSVPLFSQELRFLLEAGLGLIEIIDLLERKYRHEASRKVFYVVPRFSRVYEDLGHDLPWMSQLLMHWKNLLATMLGGWPLECCLRL